MKNLLLVLVGVCLSLAGWTQNQTVSVYFDVDKAELSAQALQSLDVLALQLVDMPDYEWRIEAHTDNTGSVAYNEALAQRRGAAVRQYLATKGLQSKSGTTVAYGERKQKMSNTTEENKQLNRRVDVIVSPISIGSFEELSLLLLGDYKNVFTISADEDQTLTAKKGTVVTIPAHSFVNGNGEKVTGLVHVEIIEALDPIDWIALGLSTTSNGDILESGGMMHIAAEQQGAPLSVAEGASLSVALPNVAMVRGNDMRLFYLNEDNATSNWEATSVPFLASNESTLPNLSGKSSRAMFVATKITVPSMPMGPKFLPKHITMKKPKAPARVIKPSAPKKKEVYKNLHIWSLSSKKKKLRAENLYQSKLSEHKKKMERYGVAKAKYEIELDSFDVEMDLYDEAMKDYSLSVDTFFQQVVSYKDSVYQHVFYKYLKAGIKGSNKLKMSMDSLPKFVVQSAIDRSLRELNVKPGNFEANYAKYMYDYRFSRDFINGYCKRQMGATYSKYEKQINLSMCNLDNYANDNAYLDVSSGQVVIPDFEQVKTNYPQFSCKRQIVNEKLQDTYDRFVVSNSFPVLELDSASYFISRFTRLGWINCDRFYNSPLPKYPMEVSEAQSNTRAFIVFSKLNSIVSLNNLNTDKSFKSADIPIDSEVEVISLRIENGKALYASEALSTSRNTSVELSNYSEMSLTDLRKKLRQL